MKKFILELSLFLSPFIFLLINYQNFQASGGDLNRLSKISFDKSYRNIFYDEHYSKVLYKDISELDLTRKDSADIIIIGDSFSQMGSNGYQNYLATDYSYNVVNINNKQNRGNPIETLYCLVNGDVLDNLQVNYIVLQSIEREFVRRREGFDTNCALNAKAFIKVSEPSNAMHKLNDLGYFQDMINYTWFNFLYQFNDKAYFSQVYKKPLVGRKLFSTTQNQILFFSEDVENIKFIKKDYILELNKKLNFIAQKLRKRNIKLIVLPSPDKYDLYNDYILGNDLPKNLFFDYMNRVPKDYLFIDAKKLLLPFLKKGVKDVYWADDTHWSPFAAQQISNEIHKVINNN